jgi:hypothetical protein
MYICLDGERTVCQWLATVDAQGARLFPHHVFITGPELQACDGRATYQNQKLYVRQGAHALVLARVIVPVSRIDLWALKQGPRGPGCPVI